MNKTKIALAIAAASMLSTPVLATNGDNMMGLGVQSRAMGGTGVAAFYGSENALTNPALLGKTQGSEFAIGGILFSPSVESTATTTGAAGSQTSDADTFLIPEISLATRLNDNWTFGMGMYGVAGLGVDYRDTPELFSGFSSLQLMKFAPAFAYNDGNFGLGIAATIMYGALDLNYIGPAGTVGNGVSTDLGTGLNIGAYYDVNKDLTVGLSYQTEVAMKYKDQLTLAADGFNIGPNGMQTINSDSLNQPAEFGVGVAYTMNEWMFTADAKQIMWGEAKGYKDFNWDNQNVYALGAKYSGNGFWVGGGYNYAEDPIDVLSVSAAPNTMTDYSNQVVNMFNNHFFPGIIETHYTIGGGYKLSKTMTLEGAFAISPEVSKTVDTGVISDAFDDGTLLVPLNDSVPAGGTSQTVKHSQTAISFSIRMNF